MSLDQIAIARAFSECGVRIAALEADLAERTRERDEHAKWRMALADRLHDRETDIAEARADAARYRWLKINARRIDFAGLCVSDGAQLDASIDAARKERTT